MPAIVEFPTIVKDALAQFGPLFANEPERIHFAEYLTGLMVAAHKNVSATNRKDTKARKILVSNRTYWEISRIVRVYHRRWRGTECFHRRGKQHLGMGDCQLRNGRGQTRHMYMVFVAHSVLMRQLRQSRACAWALGRLATIGQACMAVMRQTLSQTLSWAIERAQSDGWSCERIKLHLALA